MHYAHIYIKKMFIADTEACVMMPVGHNLLNEGHLFCVAFPAELVASNKMVTNV